MQRLLPPTDPPGAVVDPVEHVWSLERPKPARRPWVLANMISSVDGAATVKGLSAGLGGPADRAMFHALREVPDVILVAAGTVRAEGYRPLEASAEVRERRAQHGRAPLPRLAIVTRRLELDLDDPLFTAPEQSPIVITVSATPTATRTEVAERAEVLVAGDEDVDLAAALEQLGGGGAEVVLCEGGPSLLGQMVAADLVDELNLTFAPALVGGDAPRIAHGLTEQQVHAMALERVCEQDDMLLLRYLRAR